MLFHEKFYLPSNTLGLGTVYDRVYVVKITISNFNCVKTPEWFSLVALLTAEKILSFSFTYYP